MRSWLLAFPFVDGSLQFAVSDWSRLNQLSSCEQTLPTVVMPKTSPTIAPAPPRTSWKEAIHRLVESLRSGDGFPAAMAAEILSLILAHFSPRAFVSASTL